MKRIYLDNNASTLIYKRVVFSMLPYLFCNYGNPSSLHKEGRKAKLAIEKSRKEIAEILNCKPNEIFFTSGASEGNSFVAKNFNCTCSNNSHDSMILATEANRNLVFNTLPCYSHPYVDSVTATPTQLCYSDLEDWIVHCDLTQVVGKVPINLRERVQNKNGVYDYKYQLATFSGHKFGSPKGVGVLYIQEDLQRKMKPLIYGHQEQLLRGGTENVANIVGMAKALSISTKEMHKNNSHLNKLKKYLIEHLEVDYSTDTQLNLPTINITFNNLNSQTAVSIFDQYGIAISAGSACNSNEEKVDNALLEIYSEDEALRTIRVSLGRQNTLREVKRFIKILNKIVSEYDK